MRMPNMCRIYSNLGWTKVSYAASFVCLGANAKFRRRKPKVLVALAVISDIQSTFVISNSLISTNRFSKWKSGPCFNTEIYRKATKFCGKEEKLLLRSNFSSFPQYFQSISNLGVKLLIHSVKGGYSINCFPQFRKSDMSKYGYFEVFQRVPWNSR